MSLASQPWPSAILGTHRWTTLRGSLISNLSREGTNTNAYKLLTKPYPIQVLWLYGKIGMESHPNPTTISFYKRG